MPTVTAVTQPDHQSLVTISPSGHNAPLFIVHGAGGNILFLWSLARAMAGDRPIYGFQAKGVDGTDMPDPTIEEMAARYVAELRAKHQGPYLLGGYSGGGIVTFEMVRQLQALGEEVQYIVLFDSVPPGRAKPTIPQQGRNLLRNIRRHGYGPLRPYVRRRIRRAMKRFVPERRWRTDLIESEERDLGIRDVEDLGFVNLFLYFSAAAERYEMHTVDVDAAVLKAEWVWPTQPHDYYWGRYITGQLDITEVPGDHNAMFFPENAPQLAKALKSVLDRRNL
jgi:thioesterase domain-containing protein